jgi:hypothetical protein
LKVFGSHYVTWVEYPLHWLLEFYYVYEIMRLVYPWIVGYVVLIALFIILDWATFGIHSYDLFGVNCRGLLSIGILGIDILGFGLFVLHKIGNFCLYNLETLGGLLVLFGWLCSGGFWVLWFEVFNLGNFKSCYLCFTL